jgi:hypothetical protein
MVHFLTLRNYYGGKSMAQKLTIKMRLASRIPRIEETRKACNILVVTLKETVHLGDTGVGGRILFEWI